MSHIQHGPTSQIIEDIVAQASKNGGVPLLILLIGPPGCGKSTFCEELAKHLPLTVVNTDNAPDGPVQSRKAYFDYVYGLALAFSRHIVVDQTNVNHLRRHERLLKSNGHLKIAVDLFTMPVEVLYKRVKRRAELTGRYMPKHVVQELAAEYEPPSFTDGFDLIYHVEDPEHDTPN